LTIRDHKDKDRVVAKAMDYRRLIKQKLDSCSDPFVCAICRVEINELINLLFHLPEQDGGD